MQSHQRNLGLKTKCLIMRQVCAIFLLTGCGAWGTNETIAPNGSPLPASSPTGSPTTSSTAPVSRYRDPSLSNLGINLSGVYYYNNAAIFADMTKAMSANHGSWDQASGQAGSALDESGSPTEAASGSVTADYPSGDYSVSWDGSGVINVNGNGNGDSIGPASVTMVNGVQHNTAKLAHTQTQNSWITFSTIPPTTNIHIVAPTEAIFPGSYFLNDYILRLRPFTTLRFMDAQNTNGNSITNWSQRTWPNEGSRATAGGLAYEDILAIANLLVTDVWVNVPVNATDDYVCRMARLFKYGEAGDKANSSCDINAAAGTASVAPLNVTSKLYLEYSNEVWGGIPPNRNAIQSWATGAETSPSLIAQAALANKQLPWASDAYNRTSQLAKVLEKRTSDIVKNVFGSNKNQIKFVVDVQYVWPDGSTSGFDFANSVYGPVANYFDYFGVAPYFVVSNEAHTDSLDNLFADIESVSLNPDPTTPSSIANYLTQDLAMANKYHMPVITYEGGESITGFNNVQVKTAAQHDPRMYDMYQKYLAIWNQIIGHDHLFTFYTDVGGDSGWGSFGLLLQGEDLGSQKWDALMDLSQIQGDLNFDGVVDNQDCQILKSNIGQASRWWRQGDLNHDGVVDEKDLAILNAHMTSGVCSLN